MSSQTQRILCTSASSDISTDPSTDDSYNGFDASIWPCVEHLDVSWVELAVIKEQLDSAASWNGSCGSTRWVCPHNTARAAVPDCVSSKGNAHSCCKIATTVFLKPAWSINSRHGRFSSAKALTQSSACLSTYLSSLLAIDIFENKTDSLSTSPNEKTNSLLRQLRVVHSDTSEPSDWDKSAFFSLELALIRGPNMYNLNILNIWQLVSVRLSFGTKGLSNKDISRDIMGSLGSPLYI